MTPLFQKRCFFGMGEEVVSLTVFSEKLCSPENTIFVFSANTAVAVEKMHVEKQWVFEHGKRCFLFCFEVLLVLWFAFRVFVKVAQVLKCLIFPQLFGLWEGGLLFFIWVWKV